MESMLYLEVSSVNNGVAVFGRGGVLEGFEFAAEFFVLAFEALVAADVIDGPMLGGGHEPGAGVVGDARGGPLFEGGDEGVVGEVLGDADVADDAGQPGDDPGRLDPPHRVDRLPEVGGLHRLRLEAIRQEIGRAHV